MGGCAISVVLVLVAVVEVVVVSVATRKAAKMIHFNANLDSTSSTDCCEERERERGRSGGERKLLQTHTCTCCKSAHEISALLIRVTAEEVVRQKKNETEMKKQAK